MPELIRGIGTIALAISVVAVLSGRSSGGGMATSPRPRASDTGSERADSEVSAVPQADDRWGVIEDETRDVRLVVDVSDSDLAMQAMFEGRLALTDEGCVAFEGEGGTEVIVFRDGVSFSDAGTILGPSGEFELGDQIVVVGGSVPLADDALSECGGPVSVLKVADLREG